MPAPILSSGKPMLAPLTITVRTEFLKMRDSLDDLAKRQLPFAAANALTKTARLVQREETSAISQVFDRPTPFTQRAVGVKPARKTDLTSEVFIKPIQAAYLKLEETGGVRTPKKQALLLPAKIALNQYGNIPKGALQRLKGRRDIFIGQVKGIGGVWQRMPSSRGQPHRLKLLIAFKPRAAYRPRFGFNPRAKAVITAAFPLILREELAHARATAKP
jgi:hypothetical protein